MRIDGLTRILGLVGEGISHSLSPRIQNHALEQLGENLVYLPFDLPADALPELIRALPLIGCVGFNVTSPHKSAVGRLVRAGDEEASLTGVVNTVVYQAGEAIGNATDGRGFRAWIESEGLIPGSGGVVLLGFGSTARSLAHQLATVYPLTIVSRRPEAVERELQGWYAKGWAGLPARAIGWDQPPPPRPVLVVSTLPPDAGRTGEMAGWLAALDPTGILVDLNYGAGRTPLVFQARDRGLAAHDGLGLLVHQAALSLSIWLGRPVPASLLRAGLA